MEANAEQNHRGSEIESNNRLPITSADQHYYSYPIFQNKQFLHSFRPVDLTLVAAVAAAAQHKFPRSKYGR